MRVPFYDIKAQYTDLASALDAIVHEVLASGVYALGPHHNAFEKEIAELHGCKFGIALNSGTDALRIMLDAAGIGPGDEVITTAFTFVASTETIVQTGATPVFVDIDPKSFMIDPGKIRSAITSRTKAIMPVHLFGQLAPMESIQTIADENGLILLEDAAQAIGCHHKGKFAGQYGISAGFSFYVTKNLGAAGDAGLILTNDEEYAQRCRSIRIHGMGRERYYYDYLGYTSRMDEMQAAVLRIKLTKLAEWNLHRESIAEKYLVGLKSLPLDLPETLPGNNHTYHQFSIQTDQRTDLMAHLKESGVDSMIYYPVPIHFHTPYAKFGAGRGSLPVTEQVSERVVNLPVHPHLSDEQVHHVISSVKSFFGV